MIKINGIVCSNVYPKKPIFIREKKKKKERNDNTCKNRKYETTSKDISVILQKSQKGKSFVPGRRKLKNP